MSKYHGPKIYPITCQGIPAVDEAGKTSITYADDHKKVRLVYAADQHQVKRCEACQAVYAKQRNKASVNPKKALKKMVEAMGQALEVLNDVDVAPYLDEVDRAGLEEIVRRGEEAQEELAQ